MYSELVMDHFRNPHNVGAMEDADGVGKVGNPTCGDIMEMFIKVEGDRIADVKFRTFGCGAAIATSSITTDLVKGKTLDEALQLSNRAVAEALGGLPAQKMHCSNLAADALHEAIRDYRRRRGEDIGDDQAGEHDHGHEHGADDEA
jgi:nitrogen fixation NifU-like protein